MSRWLFTLLVGLVALQRLAEVRTSKRHVATLLARGATEHGTGHFPAMKALHGTWLVATVAEMWLLGRPLVPAVAIAAALGLAAGQAMRYWARRTLGERWTARILTLPGAPPVTGGPYRWVRHPNYVGVVLEIGCLPLIHGAWLTAAVYTVLNGWLLRVRMTAEEAALETANDYGRSFGATPRLWPGIASPGERNGSPPPVDGPGEVPDDAPPGGLEPGGDERKG